MMPSFGMISDLHLWAALWKLEGFFLSRISKFLPRTGRLQEAQDLSLWRASCSYANEFQCNSNLV